MSGHTAKRRRLSSSPEITLNTQSSGGSFKDRASRDSKQAGPPISGSMAKRATNDRSAEFAMANGANKSSFFKLQMDELLLNSRPNYDRQVSKTRETLQQLKYIIEQLPERPAKQALDAEKELRNLHGIAVPYPEPRPGKDTKYLVAYAKPTNVNVVGSFALRTGSRSAETYTVDMAVTMPNAIFQEKDYVNYRYFHKRAYYIASLAAGIQEEKSLDVNVKFGLHDGDALRPIVIIQPTGSTNNGFEQSKSQIRIFTAIDNTLFPIPRTWPMKNNVRQGSAGIIEPQECTPLYNASLRSEATVAPYHKFISSAARDCESFRDACLLGRIWLRQRGFGASSQAGGFGGFEWTVIMSFLFEGGGPNGKPVLLKSYSSYQLFKATLQFLAGRDLKQPLLFCASDIPFPSDSPVIYDGKRGLNVLYKMTQWSYSFLRHEANTTIKMLNESRDDNFDRVFILKVNEPLLRFDRILTLPMPESETALDSIHYQKNIYEILLKALGDRAELIYLFSCCPGPWSLEAKSNRKMGSKSLSIGFILNSENATRIVDHGPYAEQKEEAASFRSFWGDKAELRRFKDGSIRESLVWSDRSSSTIVYQILAYILKHRLNCAEKDMGYIGDEFDQKLRENGDDIVSYSSPSFQKITDDFNSLEKAFQDMAEVPLTVRQLAPASPLLRYTALRVHDSDPVDVILRFESSVRWPDDLVAIQMTKVAFLVKIGDSLTQSNYASSCRVGLENEQSSMLNNAFLDISHTSGVVFRLRIHHDREQTLLERLLKEPGASPQKKQDTAYALAAYKRCFIHGPRLTQAIRTLCTRFPLLSPTIRLAKYWFSCHLFDGHIVEELIELLVAHSFTQPYPWDSPSSIMVGLLRTLYFISRWEWQQDPMITDLGGELDRTTIETIRTRFAAWRSIDPAMNNVSLLVASDIDIDGVTWTQYQMPPRVVASRISTLAKSAMKLVRERGSDLNVSELFHPSLEPYDFIIHLQPRLLNHRSASLAKFKNLELENRCRPGKLAAIKSFVCDLQACYNPNILFFLGNEHCNMIAGLWNPQTLRPKAWSLNMPFSTLPEDLTGGGCNVSINQRAILNEISRIGSGLVHKIEVITKETAGEA